MNCEECIIRYWSPRHRLTNYVNLSDTTFPYIHLPLFWQYFYGGVALPFDNEKNINIKKQFNNEKKTVF